MAFTPIAEAANRADTPSVPVSNPAPSAAAPSSHRLLYGALLLTGFVLRFAFVLWKRTYIPPMPNAAVPFGPEVCSIARHILEGKGFSSPFFGPDTGPTAWIAPVYPYLVAAVFRIFGLYSSASALVILGFQCLLAAATGITIYLLGKRTFGERVGFYAAWIWTVSPIFFRWPASWIWDFTATALLVSVILILTLDAAEQGTLRSWLVLAAAWAILALTNPAPLSLMPFSFLYAAYFNRKARAHWVRSAASAAFLFVLLVSPWLIRNTVVFGHPVFFRSNYWFEFHLGNYHYSNGMGYMGKHPNNNPPILRKYAQLGELRFVEDAKQDAFRFIKQYPGEFLDLTIHRAWWYWDGTMLRYQDHEWWLPWEYWPLSALGWLGLLFTLTRRPTGWFLYASALLIYPIPYYLAYPNQKYRHAIEPELLLLGVYFASVLWGEITARRSSRLSR